MDITSQVILTAYNGTSTVGVLKVSKGCGKRTMLEAIYGSQASFNAARQCYLTNIVEEKKGPIPVPNTTSATLSTFTQVMESQALRKHCVFLGGAVHLRGLRM